MKIAIIQDFLRNGGTERQSVLLANAFAAAGHATALFTFRPGGALARTVAANVTHRALQPFDLHVDWFAPKLATQLHRFAPDVILCMGRLANCYAGGLQETFPRAAVISSMRTGKPLPAKFQRSLRRVRHVVANSRDARDTLVKTYRVPAEKISVIYNALVFSSSSAAEPASVASSSAASTRDALRAQHGASPTTSVLLCVAMFRPEKNQRELIAIASDLPRDSSWQLWLAGEGPARETCEQLVAAQGLASHVKFLGFHRDPTALYHAADIAVHASWSEALSNFLIEAQAHGLPAVAYQAQGIEECFVPNRTGWAIPRDDRAAFRRTLQRRMSAPRDERIALADAARAFARETFDPQRQVAAYLDLFQRL